jgi:hypothetical protein
MLSTVSNLLVALDPFGSWKKQKASEMREYLRWRRLPAALSKRVTRFEEKYSETKEDAFHAEQDLLRLLSPTLRSEVFDHVLNRTVAMIPLLAMPDATFQRAVYECLNSLLYEKGDNIISKNYENMEIYCLFKGHINVCAAYEGRVMYPMSRVGDFFGEQVYLGKRTIFTFMAAVSLPSRACLCAHVHKRTLTGAHPVWTHRFSWELAPIARAKHPFVDRTNGGSY